jgi:DDE superfamily endonuclease
MTFNVLLSSARVDVEHTIGLLKVRFPLLQCISMITGYAEDNERVIEMIEAPCTLHNFFLNQHDDLDLTPDEKGSLRVWTDRAYSEIEESVWGDNIRYDGDAINTNEWRL